MKASHSEKLGYSKGERSGNEMVHKINKNHIFDGELTFCSTVLLSHHKPL